LQHYVIFSNLFYLKFNIISLSFTSYINKHFFSKEAIRERISVEGLRKELAWIREKYDKQYESLVSCEGTQVRDKNLFSFYQASIIFTLCDN